MSTAAGVVLLFAASGAGAVVYLLIKFKPGEDTRKKSRKDKKKSGPGS